MRSTFSISSAKGCCSLLAAVCCAQAALAAGENYSLWPRRPEALAEARRLMERGSLSPALDLLQPLVKQDGVVGREAKDLIGSLRIRQVLDPNSPDVKRHVVKKGEAWTRMVKKLDCSQALMMHLNGLMDIPSLQPGDVFKYRPLDFRIVVHVPDREVCLYEGENFVKAYPILEVKDTGRKNVETVVKDEQASVTIYDRRYPAADKTLLLAAGGYVIDAKKEAPRAPGFYLNRQDCNELSMLTKAGTKVDIIREKEGAP